MEVEDGIDSSVFIVDLSNAGNGQAMTYGWVMTAFSSMVSDALHQQILTILKYIIPNTFRYMNTE